jgi:hypothetical protein
VEEQSFRQVRDAAAESKELTTKIAVGTLHNDGTSVEDSPLANMISSSHVNMSPSWNKFGLEVGLSLAYLSNIPRGKGVKLLHKIIPRSPQRLLPTIQQIHMSTLAQHQNHGWKRCHLRSIESNFETSFNQRYKSLIQKELDESNRQSTKPTVQKMYLDSSSWIVELGLALYLPAVVCPIASTALPYRCLRIGSG